MTDRPLILSVETATMAGSVAISRGREVLAVSSGDPTRSHSNTLILEIKQLLVQANLDLPLVDLFAVASGPGSFTGLRIGIATIKALAETLSRPCVGVPTLAAIASAAGPSEATVALLPAGRGEVFVQLFDVEGTDTATAIDLPAHLPPAKALERYSQLSTVCFAGPGAQMYFDLIREAAASSGRQFNLDPANEGSWRIAPATPNLAQYVASLALKRIATESGDHGPNDLKAIYVRPSDAEMKA
jgi:tRNA threonylcarbamoyladenosine biosynthesis protein TsaB